MKTKLRILILFALTLAIPMAVPARAAEDPTFGDKLKKFFAGPTPTPRKKKKPAATPEKKKSTPKSSATPKKSSTPSPSPTETPAPSSTPEDSTTPDESATPSPSVAATATATPSPTQSATVVSPPLRATPSPIRSRVKSEYLEPVRAISPGPRSKRKPAATPTFSPTPFPVRETPLPTATVVPTTPIPVPTPTRPLPSLTPPPTPTLEPKETPLLIATPEPTKTPPPSPTPRPTRTPTPTPTPRPTRSPTPEPTPQPTKTPSPTATPQPTKTASPSPSPVAKGSRGPTATVASAEISGYENNSESMRRVLDLSLDLTNRNLTYKYGSADPKNGGMDCSGFIHYVLTETGMKDVPRDAREQYIWVRKAGTFRAVLGRSDDTFELDELKPGDLLFWSGTYNIDRDPAITHVMIYLGREKDTNRRIMAGSSDGRTYKGQSRFGVSVFDFKVARLGAKTSDQPGPMFVGYGRIPGLTKE